METGENRDWKAELERCTRCGKCRSICPVFGLEPVEPMSTRGRIALFQALVEGRLSKSRRLAKYLNSCLRCLSCISVCSAGVKYNLIQTEFRRRLIHPFSRAWLLRLILRMVLPSRGASDLVAGVLPGIFAGRLSTPRRAKASALRQLSHLPRLPNPRMRVGLFLGCLANYLYPEIASDIIKLFRQANIETVIPEKQLCCGAPALALGDVKLARQLAENNIRALEETGADYYVTPCALGASTIKTDYPDIVASSARPVSNRLYELSEFVCKFIDLTGFKRIAQTVTYHAPCHLRGVQGIEEAPREILSRASRYVEMDGAELCCGAGNLLAVFQADLSNRLAEAKVRAIRNTPAEVVATGCPIGMLQLETQLTRAGVQKQVCHVAQISARGLAGESSKIGGK